MNSTWIPSSSLFFTSCQDGKLAWYAATPALEEMGDAQSLTCRRRARCPTPTERWPGGLRLTDSHGRLWRFILDLCFLVWFWKKIINTHILNYIQYIHRPTFHPFIGNHSVSNSTNNNTQMAQMADATIQPNAKPSMASLKPPVELGPDPPDPSTPRWSMTIFKLILISFCGIIESDDKVAELSFCSKLCGSACVHSVATHSGWFLKNQWDRWNMMKRKIEKTYHPEFCPSHQLRNRFYQSSIAYTKFYQVQPPRHFPRLHDVVMLELCLVLRAKAGTKDVERWHQRGWKNPEVNPVHLKMR